MAYRLQEQECTLFDSFCTSRVDDVFHIPTDEDHFNSNVQLRRTARYDSSVATVLQKEENKLFEEETKQKRLK